MLIQLEEKDQVICIIYMRSWSFFFSKAVYE